MINRVWMMRVGISRSSDGVLDERCTVHDHHEGALFDALRYPASQLLRLIERLLIFASPLPHTLAPPCMSEL